MNSLTERMWLGQLVGATLAVATTGKSVGAAAIDQKPIVNAFRADAVAEFVTVDHAPMIVDSDAHVLPGQPTADTRWEVAAATDVKDGSFLDVVLVAESREFIASGTYDQATFQYFRDGVLHATGDFTITCNRGSDATVDVPGSCVVYAHYSDESKWGMPNVVSLEWIGSDTTEDSVAGEPMMSIAGGGSGSGRRGVGVEVSIELATELARADELPRCSVGTRQTVAYLAPCRYDTPVLCPPEGCHEYQWFCQLQECVNAPCGWSDCETSWQNIGDPEPCSVCYGFQANGPPIEPPMGTISHVEPPPPGGPVSGTSCVLGTLRRLQYGRPCSSGSGMQLWCELQRCGNNFWVSGRRWTRIGRPYLCSECLHGVTTGSRDTVPPTQAPASQPSVESGRRGSGH